jgi:tetratricopeptide (TPR) repeat protein
MMNRIEKIMEMMLENPKDSFLCHALALEYIKIGRDADARKLFETLLDNEPAYIGSYYHLGKLLERQQETDLAIKVYQRGMEEAKKAGDNHALAELKAVYEELIY